MKENFYKTKLHKTGHYKTDHTCFGGKVYLSDFDTNHPNGQIANRIAQDLRFDYQCRKNIEMKRMEMISNE